LLVAIPLGAAVATETIALASPASSWLLPIGAFAAGTLMLAWHAVAWLFVINTSHPQSIGRSSAIMQVGTFLGFGSGPPLTGFLVDGSGSYNLNWAVVIALFSVVSLMALRLRHYLAIQAVDGNE
jgi:cyanate permease